MKGLKKKREQAGLSQRTLADALTIKIKNLQNWEQGVCLPSLEMAHRIAKFFNCTIEDLF